MAIKDADRQRKLRREALVEFLSKKCTVQQVVAIIEKIESQYEDLESTQLAALKAAADLRVKLLGKYLPDVKSVEVEGEIDHSGGIKITWEK